MKVKFRRETGSSSKAGGGRGDQDHPKRRPSGPKTPKERPKTLQEGLKSTAGGSKKASRASELHPRCPAKSLPATNAQNSRAGGGVPPQGKAIRRHPKGRSVSKRISKSSSNSSNSKSLARARAFRQAPGGGSPGPPKSFQNLSKNKSKIWCHFGIVFGAS